MEGGVIMKEKYEKAKVEILEFKQVEVLTDSYIELPPQPFE